MATYISNQTGLWSSASTWLTATAGTLSPTAPAGNAPQSGGGDKFIIRHTVTYDVEGEFGDQSSFFILSLTNYNTITGNAIFLSGGTLKASRTTNTSLTARGTIVIGASGSLDWGTTIDPLTTTSTITLNYVTNAAILSTSKGSAGIYLWGVNNATGFARNSIYLNGLTKTRNTYLTVSAASGANVISVASVSGWNAGDTLYVQTENISSVNTGLSSLTITGITGLNVGITPTLNTFRLSGRCVSNFSSNVTINSYNRLYQGFGLLLYESRDTIIDINNISLKEIGHTAWTFYGNGIIAGANQTANANASFCRYIENQTVGYTHKNISIEQTNNETYGSLTINGGVSDYSAIDNFCSVGNLNATTSFFTPNGGVLVKILNSNVYRSAYFWNNGTTPSKNVIINNCVIDTFINFTHPQNTLASNIAFNNCKIRTSGTTGYIIAASNTNANFSNCYLEYKNTDGAISFLDTGYGSVYFKDCTLNGGKLKNSAANAFKSTRVFDAWIYRPILANNALSSVNTYTRFNSYYYAESDFSTRKRGLNSYRIRPELSNTLFEVYENIPAINGVSQIIKGSLRFDSNYGTSNPPSISFVGAGINTTFTCTSSINTWQDFEYNFTPTLTEDIIVTITGQSTLTSGYVWLDGLTLPPMVQDVRHYGYIFNKNIYRTVNTLNTLTENQVSGLAVVNNLDYLYDAASYWSVTNPASSSYIDLYTVNGTVLDFGSKNIVVNNTGSGFTYNQATNTITINSASLSAGNNFNTLKTTGTVTLSTGIISNLDINANIVQNIPTNLSGIFMLSASNTLTYNTNTPIEIEYINSTMVGVKNDGSAIVTIKRTNSTVTESDAEILTYAPTLINLTLQSGYIALYDNSGTRQYYQNTDGTLLLPANATGNWSYKISKYGYQLITGSFTVNPNIGASIDLTPSYVPDTFITQSNVSVVSSYTDLNTTDKIHDYLSYYLTTSIGINYGILDSESFGVLSFYGNLVLSNSATSIVDYNIGTNTLKLKSSSLNDSIIFVVASAFSQDGGNTIGDTMKIRSSNIDSELYFNNVEKIVFYPTELDRDNNTNQSLSSSGTIYRFKYGSTINGTTFSNYIYCRVTVGGVTLLNTTPISQGSTTIDFSTTGNIQTLLANQRIINTGVQKASKLIPHTTNV